MILSPAEAASAARWSAFWEFSEYASEAIVFLGCVGEYIAEYTKWRTEQARHALGKVSLVLLILGLGTGLFSLIKTNALAGILIGSLGEQAGQATDKARQALDSSSLAITQSKKAVGESGQAVISASNAAITARGARQEADSFEKDIVSAKKQAADAESHLAEALQRTVRAETQLARIRQPRSLGIEQQERVGNAMLRFSGQNFAFLVFGDPDSLGLLGNMDAALRIAKWNRVSAPAGMGGDIGYNTAGGMVQSYNDVGLKLWIGADDTTAAGAAASLAAAITAEGIPCEPHLSERMRGIMPRLILITIGQKQL